ncbi:MAG TPA: LLM class flavin-dependent oxidoreductase [Kofleriaceae bacterium]|nr:LLM class flavin-dependent oxidoreductase [Kofleriaceae bacterium]
MKLGVLDFGRIEEAIELAPVAEQLGYARYWLGEHQPQPSPVLMASIIASQTAHIRVGTAGILLHYYPPLRTAHDLHLLERAYTGRIDAGFCGGLVDSALIEIDRDGRNFPALLAAYPERARRFVQALRNTRGSPAFDRPVAWSEVGEDPPEIWSLGGGGRSAELAAELGLGLGYALMFTWCRDEPDVTQQYRARFVPHPDREAAAVIVAVAGVCAETDADARRIADAAVAANASFMPRIVGAPQACAAALAALAERYAADEIVFLQLGGPRAERARGYELLAAACGLAPPIPPGE